MSAPVQAHYGIYRNPGFTTWAGSEAAMGRFKQVIGDGLRSCTDERCPTKVDVAFHALNRTAELEHPNYVRTA